MVSVDVKHHVYLVTNLHDGHLDFHTELSPSSEGPTCRLLKCCFTLLNVIIFIRPNSETAAGAICDALLLIVFCLLFDNFPSLMLVLSRLSHNFRTLTLSVVVFEVLLYVHRNPA